MYIFFYTKICVNVVLEYYKESKIKIDIEKKNTVSYYKGYKKKKQNL